MLIRNRQRPSCTRPRGAAFMAIITSFSRGHGMALFLVLFNRCRVPLFPVRESPSALSGRARILMSEAAGLLFRRVLDNLAVSAFGGGSAWSLGFPFPQTNSVVSAGLTFCYGLAWLDNDGLKPPILYAKRLIQVPCCSPLLEAKDGGRTVIPGFAVRYIFHYVT
ncbi:hypothetical protein L1887_59388 [Cichorium endivia]|nr:hypothetical protein L1887_59388 [Cichorium endivia]